MSLRRLRRRLVIAYCRFIGDGREVSVRGLNRAMARAKREREALENSYYIEPDTRDPLIRKIITGDGAGRRVWRRRLNDG